MRDRTEKIKRYCGCLPCLLEGIANVYCEEHHIVFGMRRVGHQATYGNCQWHHRGIAPRREGPTLVLDVRKYRKRYGSEQRLLATQNFMLYLHSQTPWLEFELPANVAAKVRAFWGSLID